MASVAEMKPVTPRKDDKGKTLDEIMGMTIEEQLAYFGAPPQGMRYTKAGKDGVKKLVIDGATLRPFTTPSKKGGKRNKPKKPTYAVPQGKLRSAETPDFNVKLHAKLKQSDFNDPLDYAKWSVWYFEQLLTSAKNEVSNIEKLGSNADERRANADLNRQVTAMENLAKKMENNPNLKSILQERLGKLFANVSNG